MGQIVMWVNVWFPTSLGIGVKATQNILKDGFGVWKLCTSHNLSYEQNQARVEWCKEMLRYSTKVLEISYTTSWPVTKNIGFTHMSVGVRRRAKDNKSCCVEVFGSHVSEIHKSTSLKWQKCFEKCFERMHKCIILEKRVFFHWTLSFFVIATKLSVNAN